MKTFKDGPRWTVRSRCSPPAFVVISVILVYFFWSHNPTAKPPSPITNNPSPSGVVMPSDLSNTNGSNKQASIHNEPELEEVKSGDPSIVQYSSDCQTIVFFHVPKTGGESLNDLWHTYFMKGELIDRRLFGWKDYKTTSIRQTDMTPAQQAKFFQNRTPWEGDNEEQRLVIELHCGNSMSFMQAHAALRQMRKAHEENSCGIFAFTIIRSPIDWVVSLYDDICHRRLRGHQDTCPQKEGMSSRDEMLTYPHENGMVSYLCHGWNGWASPGAVDEESVKELVEKLEENLDVVAMTPEVPKLRQYLTHSFANEGAQLTKEQETRLNNRSKQNANMQKTISVTDFSPDDIERLNATVQLDWQLYRHFETEPRPW